MSNNPNDPQRLQKIIAQAGIASRRKAETFITDGRVKVNGKVIKELGAKAVPNQDTIEVEGYGVLSAQKHVYIALYKPEHVISTVVDPEGRDTVIDVLRDTRAVGKRAYEGDLPRVFPVGRLDFDAEGILLLTNDGDLSHQLLHPKQHVPKTYLVKIKGRADPKALERLRNGVRLPTEDGSLGPRSGPADISVFKEAVANSWIEMTIFEGRNHQIKRMCQAVGLRLLRLIRTDFAGIAAEPLQPGEWRFLDKAELTHLKNWGR